MPRRTAHIAKKLKGTATLLFLLLCVCSAVARDTTRVFSKLPWGENLVAGDGYLSYYAYGYDGNRAIKMTGNAAIDQTVVRLLASLSFNFWSFFCLETKETKVQGCEKKAKKRLRSAEAVKLAPRPRHGARWWTDARP